MKEIIHLSDLHVGFGHCANLLNLVVTKIIFLKKPASNYIVILTGDLVENGGRDGLYEAALVEVDRLKKAGFKILTAKIGCLLFGHNHDGGVWNGTWGIPRCYDAGSSTRKIFDNPAKLSPIRVIDLSRDPRFDYDLGNPPRHRLIAARSPPDLP